MPGDFKETTDDAAVFSLRQTDDIDMGNDIGTANMEFCHQIIGDRVRVEDEASAHTLGDGGNGAIAAADFDDGGGVTSDALRASSVARRASEPDSRMIRRSPLRFFI